MPEMLELDWLRIGGGIAVTALVGVVMPLLGAVLSLGRSRRGRACAEGALVTLPVPYRIFGAVVLVVWAGVLAWDLATAGPSGRTVIFGVATLGCLVFASLGTMRISWTDEGVTRRWLRFHDHVPFDAVTKVDLARPASLLVHGAGRVVEVPTYFDGAPALVLVLARRTRPEDWTERARPLVARARANRLPGLFD
ncbi:MAG: hypothetical protein ACK4YP_21060 [Myxococcota bacterium]